MKVLRGFLVILSFIIFGIGSLILSFLFLPIAGIFLKNKQKREYFSKIIHIMENFYRIFNFYTNN